MATATRQLTATFSDGSAMTRATKIPTLSHAWKVWYERTDGCLAGQKGVGTGFASGIEKAHAAARREYPAGGRWATFRIDSIEVVECEVA